MSLTPQAVHQSVHESIELLKSKPGALLPILHEIQARLGYIPKETVATIAKGLNLSVAEVHGVISFYHQFRTQPGGAHTVEVCRAEACQARGSRALEAHAKASLGVDYHQTTQDREVTLEAVYCLGNCACGPSVRIDDQIYARVSPERFDDLISELRTKTLEVANG